MCVLNSSRGNVMKVSEKNVVAEMTLDKPHANMMLACLRVAAGELPIDELAEREVLQARDWIKALLALDAFVLPAFHTDRDWH